MSMLMEKPDYRRVKIEVMGILNRCGITSPPVDPVQISRELGVDVIFVGFNKEHNNISGFYDFEENAIYVNRDEIPLRQTFTVAHELGHSILHREWAKSSEYKILMRDQLFDGDDFHEKEANAFAAHLLVPRFMLDRYWRHASEEQLSQMFAVFAVSVPVIRNRIAFEYGVR